jgi:hypothetical protein
MEIEMVASVANPKPGVAGVHGDTERLAIPRRGRTGIQPPPNPEPPHLQAIHAGKHGVIIKGMHHETFWEWHV